MTFPLRHTHTQQTQAASEDARRVSRRSEGQEPSERAHLWLPCVPKNAAVGPPSPFSVCREPGTGPDGREARWAAPRAVIPGPDPSRLSAVPRRLLRVRPLLAFPEGEPFFLCLHALLSPWNRLSVVVLGTVSKR